MDTYTPDLPIQWLINTINTSVAASLNKVAGNLISDLAPIGVAGLGIYVILMMFNYMRGSETLPIMDFFMKLISWSVIIGYGLNAATYTSTILPLVTGLGGELTHVVTGGVFDSHILDVMTVNYLGIIDKGFASLKDLGVLEMIFPAIMMVFKAILLIVGVVPFLVIAISFTLLANIGSQIIAAVGPLFFLFLLFPATRQYFSSWLNTAFSYALIPAFIGIISLLASSVSLQIMGLDDNGAGNPITLKDVAIANVFVAAIANFVFIFLLKQVSSIASSLSAGGINAGMGSAGSAIMGAAKGAASEAKGIGDRKEGRASRTESQISRGENQNRRANATNKIKGG